MLDSPEGVCAGQVELEYPATSVPSSKIPWSGFDLINAYNAWKCDEAAGRVFVAAPDGLSSSV